MFKQIQKNIIVIAVIVVGIAIAGVVAFGPNIKSEGKMNPKEAEEKVTAFIKDILLGGQANVSISNFKTEDSLYKFDVLLDGNSFPSYMSLDGKLLFPEALNMEEITNSFNNPASAQTGTGTAEIGAETPENINQIVSCLEKENFVIYGAEWCGFCKQLVDMFGGYDVVDPIYVECTIEEELCKNEGVTSYPTIKIKGEQFTGQRTFEAFAASTGCSF